MNIKHFEIRRTFSFFFFFLFCGGGGWGFKEPLEVGLDLHILIPSPSTVSFSNHRALNLKKMQTSEKPLEIGPTFVKDIRFFQRLWTQKRTE